MFSQLPVGCKGGGVALENILPMTAWLGWAAGFGGAILGHKLKGEGYRMCAAAATFFATSARLRFWTCALQFFFLFRRGKCDCSSSKMCKHSEVRCSGWCAGYFRSVLFCLGGETWMFPTLAFLWRTWWGIGRKCYKKRHSLACGWWGNEIDFECDKIESN